MKNTLRMGGKLDAKWTGPYEVVEKFSKGRYRLKKDGKTLKKLYTGDLLKDHLQPKSTTDPPSECEAYCCIVCDLN